MNRLNQTESAIFNLSWLILRDLSPLPDFITSQQPKSSACVAAVKRRPVLLCSVVIFSGPSGSFISTLFVENRILLKPVLEGVSSVACTCTITADEQTQ